MCKRWGRKKKGGNEGEGDKTQRDKATNRKPNSQKQTISAHFGLPNAPKTQRPSHTHAHTEKSLDLKVKSAAT